MANLASLSGVRLSVTITPNNSTVINPTRCILVDVSGNVKVTYNDKSSSSDTVYLVSGVWHPMQVKIIWATGTTATGIHAGY